MRVESQIEQWLAVFQNTRTLFKSGSNKGKKKTVNKRRGSTLTASGVEWQLTRTLGGWRNFFLKPF